MKKKVKYLIVALICILIPLYFYIVKANVATDLNTNNWLSNEIALQKGKTIDALTQSDYESITAIYKSSSDIYEIPETISYCINLDSLKLAGNKITSVPNSLINLPKLKNLDLSNNYLVEIQDNTIENLNVDNNLLEGHGNQDSIKLKDKYEYVNLIQFKDYEIAREYITKTGVTEDIKFPLNLNIVPSDNSFFKDNMPDKYGDTTCNIEIIGASVSNNVARIVDAPVKITAGSTIAQMESLINEDNWLSREVAAQRGKSVAELTKDDYENIIDINKSKSNLTTVPQTIGLCKNLTGLNIYGNELNIIQEEIFNLLNLQVLYCHCNEIKKIPKGIKNIKALNVLCIRDNPIEEFIPEIYELTSLVALEIYGTFSSIPTGISKLMNLDHLNISYSNITEFPLEILQLKNLEILSFYGNKISSIPDEISVLSNLKTIWISGNNLNNIPSGVLKLESLEELRVEGNNISVIPNEIQNLVKLKFLDLTDNLLTSLPENIQYLPNIENLYLGNNRFDSIPKEIEKLSRLKILAIDGNLVENVPDFITNLTNLERLYLNNNNIKNLPSSINKLINLKELQLSDNKLEGKIPSEIGELTNLEVLNLKNNNLIGEIPSSFNNLVNIINNGFNVENNNLYGVVPAAIKDKDPILANNMLDGEENQFQIKAKVKEINIKKGETLPSTLSNLYTVSKDLITTELNSQYKMEYVFDDRSYFDDTFKAIKGGTTNIKVKIHDDGIGYNKTVSEEIMVYIEEPPLPQITNISGNYTENGWVNSDVYLKINGIGSLFYNIDNTLWEEIKNEVVQVSNGGNHTLILLRNGDVYSFGNGANGKLGLGNTNNVYIPTKIKTLSNIKYVDAGPNHSLFIKDDGTVYAVGKGIDGQLGLNEYVDKNIPAKVMVDVPIKKVDCGEAFSLFLAENGDLYVTGLGGSGALGMGDQVSHGMPNLVRNINNIKDIAAGYSYSLILLNNGDVYGTGHNYDGQLGTVTGGHKVSFEKIPVLSNVSKIYANNKTSFVINDNNELYGFGYGVDGNLGTGTNLSNYVPTRVNLDRVKDVSVGYDHTMVLTYNDELYTFGNGIKYGLGHGDTNSLNIPKKVEGLSNIKSISAGINNSMILTNSYDLYSVGSGANGSLGENNTSDLTVFKYINSVSDLKNVVVDTEGMHIVQAQAKDIVNGIDSAIKTIKFGIDKSKPTINTEIVNTTFNKAEIKITSSDVYSGVDHIELPDGTKVYNSETIYTTNKNGKHTFKVVDKVGLSSSVVVDITNIDDGKPNKPSFKENNEKISLIDNGDITSLTYVKTTNEGFEDDIFDYDITYGGNNTAWSRQTNPHTGSYSYKSASIGNNQSTSFQFTVVVPPGEKVTPNFSFWYKVGSFGNDYFNFYVDGTRITRDSGNQSWKQYSTTLSPGSHVIKFEYSKDFLVSGNGDSVYIDDIKFDKTVTDVKVASGIKELQYNLDNLGWVKYSGELTLAPGNHNLQAKAIDNALNESDILVKDFKVSLKPKIQMQDFKVTLIDDNPINDRKKLQYKINNETNWNDYSKPFEIVFNSSGVCNIETRSINIQDRYSASEFYTVDNILELINTSSDINFGQRDPGVYTESNNIEYKVTSSLSYKAELESPKFFTSNLTGFNLSVDNLEYKFNSSEFNALKEGVNQVGDFLPNGVNKLDILKFRLKPNMGIPKDNYNLQLNYVITQK